MIRNVSDKTTGGIGAIRYAENGVTAKIPLTYVVDAGKTVVLFKENTGGNGGNSGDGLDDSYTYLYRNGSFTDLVTMIKKHEVSPATFTEGSDGLILHCPAEDEYMFVGFTTTNAIVPMNNASARTYTKIGILYDYTGPDWTNNTDGYGLGLFLVETSTDSTSPYAKSLRPSASEKDKIEYVDISAVPSYYQRLCANIYLREEDYGTEITWKIKAIWLE